MPTTALDPELPVLSQQHDAYSAEDHAVWHLLYERRMAALETTGSRVYLEGAARIGLAADRVPDLAQLNTRLAPLTGWQAIGVRGFIPAAAFFRSLARRRFPTTLPVRPRAQLDYLPEPDIFHDVFGHVPLHASPDFADFLQGFGQLAAAATTPEDTEAMARLFWFTVEFGLVREAGRVRVYGSGLISSHGDAAHALGPSCHRRPFVLAEVLAQPFVIDRYQDTLFVLDDFAQLHDAVQHLARTRGHAALT